MLGSDDEGQTGLKVLRENLGARRDQEGYMGQGCVMGSEGYLANLCLYETPFPFLVSTL